MPDTDGGGGFDSFDLDIFRKYNYFGVNSTNFMALLP